MFVHYESIHKSIKAALDTNNDIDEALVTKVMDNYSHRSNFVGGLKQSLDKIIHIQNLRSRERASVSGASPLNSTMKEASSPLPIKLEKPRARKFSGQPQDFV